ncbi:flagellar motor protein MotB [Naasia sp. SYSU D00948]|uniref:OmpA/MotB family protein n=1 Tax=Naasia sp. SYSU D00948 TaxID=2817379 RepID=UPI001B30EB3A|nr:flagellar motor protein MotB [Naasia sp. SYSU D00948]
MSGHKRRRGGGHGGEFHMDERWMTSYADMVTVLMCLFIVLYAMSTVDQAKFEKLANSLATGFGQTASETVDTAEGVVVPADMVDDQGEGFTPLQLAQQQVHELEDIKQRIDDALAGAGVDASAEAVIDVDGLTVGLVGEDTFFDGNSAVLKPEAEAVLRSIAPVLAPLQNQITVEGHADPHGSPAPFATDWELSAARSTAVLRFLVESGGVQGPQISAVSYGSTRPTQLAVPQADHANRRVDIVVRPTSSPAVSALIPDVVAGEAGEDSGRGEEKTPGHGEEKTPGHSAETVSTAGGGH